MIIIPLGTIAGVPTAKKNVLSVALWNEGQIHLFDCSENAQMSLLKAGIKRAKIGYIYISHSCLDHYMGLLGLLYTFQIQGHNKELKIIGPKGIRDFVTWNFEHVNRSNFNFLISYKELDDDFDYGIVVDEKDYQVECGRLNHPNFSVGYCIREKRPNSISSHDVDSVTNEKTTPSVEQEKQSKEEKSFAYITDTLYCNNAVKLSHNTSIAFIESMYCSEFEETAKKKGYCTATDAAMIAKESGTKLLVIGHFSPRYCYKTKKLLYEAKKIFNPVWVAQELKPIYTNKEADGSILKPKVDGTSSYGNKRKIQKKKNLRRRKPSVNSKNNTPQNSNNNYDIEDFDYEENRF